MSAVEQQSRRIAELEQQLAMGQAAPTPSAPAEAAPPQDPLVKENPQAEQNSATRWPADLWARHQQAYARKSFGTTSMPLAEFVKKIADPSILDMMAAYSCPEGDVEVYTSPDTENPVSLAVLPCQWGAGDYRVLIKLTPSGAELIYNLAHFGFMYSSGRIVGVSDVDGNGHLEIWARGTVHEGDDSEESQQIDAEGLVALEELGGVVFFRGGDAGGLRHVLGE